MRCGLAAFAKMLELVKGPVECAFDAGLVTEQIFDGARVAGIVEEDECLALDLFESGVVAFHALGKFVDAQVEQPGLDAAQTLEAPGGHDHLVDQQIFGGADGLVLGLKGFEHLLEVFCIFVVEDGDFGGEAVAQSVETDGSASARSLGAGAFLSIAAIGVDLSL